MFAFYVCVWATILLSVGFVIGSENRTAKAVLAANKSEAHISNSIAVNDTKSDPLKTSIFGGVNELIQSTLPFAMKSLGMIECQKESSNSSELFYDQILESDDNYNQSEGLCGSTCRGKCIPRPSDVGIPPSMYPFGCHCAQQGCDLKGPLVAPLSRSIFEISCKKESLCTCVGMGPGQFTGYACQWKNTLSGLPITFSENVFTSKLSPGILGGREVRRPGSSFSPIRWCSCCPRIPILRN